MVAQGGAALVSVGGGRAGLRMPDSASVKTCGAISSQTGRVFPAAVLAAGFLSGCWGLAGSSAEQDAGNHDGS